MNVFLVDDHPIVMEGYYNALSTDSFEIYEKTFIKACNCEEIGLY